MQMQDPDQLLYKAREPQRQRHGEPALKHPSFNWTAQDRYSEVCNIEMKVMNFLETKAYELTDEEKAHIIMNWLGRESLQLIKTFTNEEKEKCK